MQVIPSAGRTIRNPYTYVLLSANDPTNVPDNDFFWTRRVIDGDLIVVEQPKKIED